MDMPITRAAAYFKRNRTTHSWYGDWLSPNDLMSRSCPSPRTLEEHMRNARAARGMATSYHQRSSDASDSAPVVVRAKTKARGFDQAPSSSSSSPGRTTAAKVSPGRGSHPEEERRPSSAYSYDGGFFVTANNAAKDFFVIDPEWVSEDGSVKKLSGGDEAKKIVTQSKAPPRVITWKSYKRSRSAPPIKYRNPITWQDRE